MKRTRNVHDPLVKFLHYRLIDGVNTDINGNETVSCRGGATVAYKKTGEGEYVLAKAHCHARDNFNRHIGRVKSEGRLKSSKYLITVTDVPSEDALVDRLDSDYASIQYVRQERKRNRAEKAIGHD